MKKSYFLLPFVLLSSAFLGIQTFADTASESIPKTDISQDFTEQTPNINASFYIDGIGWQQTIQESEALPFNAGNKKIQAIRLNLSNTTIAGSIQYQTLVNTSGWKGATQNGISNGSLSKNTQIEGIRIQLTGDLAKKYDVLYRAYTQKHGWLSWTKNYANAGSFGFNLRLENLQVKIVKKNSVKTNGKAFLDAATPVYRLYNPSTKNYSFTQSNTTRINDYYFKSYRDDSVKFSSLSNGAVKVYELYNPKTKKTFYTAKTSEKKKYLKLKWKNKGVVFRGTKSGKAIYRLYNPKTDTYVWADATEKKRAFRSWKNQGISFYVSKEERAAQPKKKPTLAPIKIQKNYLGTGNMRLTAKNLPKHGKVSVTFKTWSDNSGKDDVVTSKNNEVIRSTSFKSKGAMTTNVYITVGRFKKVFSNSTHFTFNRFSYAPTAYYSQQDRKWANVFLGNPKNGGATIGNSGCVPTSIAMALSGFGVDINPLEMAKFLFKNTKFNHPNVGPGTPGDAVVKGIRKKGFTVELLSTRAKLVKNLKMGRPVIALLAPPYAPAGFTHGVLLYGYLDGKTTILDPLPSAQNGAWQNSSGKNKVENIWKHQSQDKHDRNAGSVFFAIRE